MARKKKSKLDEEIIARAKGRFKRCQEWEGEFRTRFSDDIKFLYADSDNHDQWPASIRAQRQLDSRPMVTVNKTHTHWLHVVNQGRENKASIKVIATGGNASYESSQIYTQVARRIEYASDAQSAYDIARGFQVGGGIGYVRVVTDYSDENGFDQEIFIRPVPDPLSVYMDPMIKQKDGSDAKFAFVYDEIDRDDFENRYPNVDLGSDFDVSMSSGWVSSKTVRLAEYYEVEETTEWAFAVPDGNGDMTFVRESEIDPSVVKLYLTAAVQGDDEDLEVTVEIQKRKVKKRQVKWYLLAGNHIIDRRDWPGKTIPIVRFIGEEVILNGKMDRKGLVRYMKDAQRMYNYNTSGQIEFGALQSKTPYIGPIEAIEGHENYWTTANRENHAYLPFNHMDENGNPVAPPQRQQPPVASEAFSVGIQNAQVEMMMASGQYESTFGAQSQELSGRALERRKSQGERATFHYLENESCAKRYLGKIIIDLAPKIYDTKRVIRIMAEDGEEQEITVDPSLTGPIEEQENSLENKTATLFNPAMGAYDVVAEVGPNFETRRQEAFEAMKEMIVGVPQLAQVIGDLFVSQGDFPSADRIAERMRNWIPAEIRGDGPSQQEQHLMQQNQELMQMVQQMGAELQSKKNMESLAKQEIEQKTLDHLAERMEADKRVLLDAFKAETDRLKAVQAAASPEAMAPVVMQAVLDALAARSPTAMAEDGISGGAAMGIGLTATDLGKPIHPEVPQQ
jgi:hypothetical protein